MDKRALALALATAIAVPAEGLRQYAYRDPVGLPTICMGSTQGVKMGDFRTLPECKALLDKDMLHAIDTVDKCRPGLPVNMLAAFSDLTYNVGPVAVCDVSKSTLARMLNMKDYKGACLQIIRWNKARVLGVMVELPGLVKRRNAEMQLCLKGLQ